MTSQKDSLSDVISTLKGLIFLIGKIRYSGKMVSQGSRPFLSVVRVKRRHCQANEFATATSEFHS